MLLNGADPNDSDESNPGYCYRMSYRIDCPGANKKRRFKRDRMKKNG
jgi:hypothetical protein